MVWLWFGFGLAMVSQSKWLSAWVVVDMEHDLLIFVLILDEIVERIRPTE